MDTITRSAKSLTFINPGMPEPINVTKTFLPSLEEYSQQLKRVWKNGWITNNGELVRELEQKLKEYLGIKHLLFCSNGTTALQMAIRALDITGEVITTPFSYVATTTAILWEHCTPVFADINEFDFCINTDRIEAAITTKTQAILATHVYGLPCNVEKIGALARKYKLKVIYDGAHAFGSRLNQQSLISYGDISTCSFHATKIFHTAEGGSVSTNSQELIDKLFLFRSFGHIGDDYYTMGINGKNSELHAALGLCMLPELPAIIEAQKEISLRYDKALASQVSRPISKAANFEYNYSYYPVIFKSEEQLLTVKNKLADNEIYTRRYFYPSLNNLPYLDHQPSCPVSEDLSGRVLCLPLYVGLKEKDQDRICELILDIIK
jgi:dTDP-4-amino-4,6-dideoxygalactose transaminase